MHFQTCSRHQCISFLTPSVISHHHHALSPVQMPLRKSSKPTTCAPRAARTSPKQEANAAPEEAAAPIAYFSYGSNMDPTKLTARTSLPQTPPHCVAHLRDHALAFDVRGMLPNDPVFCSVTPRANEIVHGILFHIPTTSAWRALLSSEGALTARPIYDVRVVTVHDADGKSYSAYTLFVDHRSYVPYVGLFPSRRYMRLLISGARAAGMPETYVTQLEQMRTCRKWNKSPLLFMMLLTLPLLYAARCRQWTWVEPLRLGGARMLAWHEMARRNESGRCERFGMIVSFLALCLLYAAYFVPAVCVTVWRGRWGMICGIFNASEQEKDG